MYGCMYRCMYVCMYGRMDVWSWTTMTGRRDGAEIGKSVLNGSCGAVEARGQAAVLL